MWNEWSPMGLSLTLLLTLVYIDRNREAISGPGWKDQTGSLLQEIETPPYHFTFHDEQVISNGEDARKVIKFFVSADFVSSSVLNNGASGAWDVGISDDVNVGTGPKRGVTGLICPLSDERGCTLPMDYP
uniref:Uncharacterized protein n=1 Tax=Anopheles coluzzii TaxID=1518534 RepID=A0A8W7Q3D1_ANOCL